MKTVDKKKALESAITIATASASSGNDKKTVIPLLRDAYKAIIKISETIEDPEI